MVAKLAQSYAAAHQLDDEEAAQRFVGLDATKERLLKLAKPGILHIATHGFFLEDCAAPSAWREPKRSS